MVDNLQVAFDRLTERYLDRMSSSDEEIAVEFQVPTPSRKHKLKHNSGEFSDEEHKLKKKHKLHHIDDVLSSTENLNRDSNEIVQCGQEGNNEKKRYKEKSHRRHKHSKRGKSLKDRKKNSKKIKKAEKRKRKAEKLNLKSSKNSKLKRKKFKCKNQQDFDDGKSTMSVESLESYNRSRSASPLPSIHSPSLSPKLLEQLNDSDFYKDKYDKIKERRRQTVKDGLDARSDRPKNIEKQKLNLLVSGKDKNQKLRETIEKLKAKNEKYKENTSIFDNLFSKKNHVNDSQTESILLEKNDKHLINEIAEKKSDEYEFVDDIDNIKNDEKGSPKTFIHSTDNSKKQTIAKNESATEALEQAVKDISLWLTDDPKVSQASSPSDSPAQTYDQDSTTSKTDDDNSLTSTEKNIKKEPNKKKLIGKDKSLQKRREMQRTIDRLQPGKSKGNLLTNTSVTTIKPEDVPSPGSVNKPRDIKNSLVMKSGEDSPKLRLGSVLPSVGFGLVQQHNFVEVQKKEHVKEAIIESEEPKETSLKNDEITEEVVHVEQKKTEIESKPEEIKEDISPSEACATPKHSQEKATPNLSAWFKAFGAPKSGTTPKKKLEDEHDEKLIGILDNKPASPINTPKHESPPEEASTPDRESPLPSTNPTSRQRRTSTGSSISERSSFSQDLDSPRHLMSHSSPLVQSPASPRAEELQKITYPILNGTVRAGFYQDTASIKSSPEKSCSPRDAPQSPYSPYAQHVYASNNAALASQTPTYLLEQNKSPLPNHGPNQISRSYDPHKDNIVNKPITNELTSDYPTPSSETPYQQTGNVFPRNKSSNQPIYRPNLSSRFVVDNLPVSDLNLEDSKIDKQTVYPVKKRSFTESGCSITNHLVDIDTTITDSTKEPSNILNRNVNSLESNTEVRVFTDNIGSNILPINSPDSTTHSNEKQISTLSTDNVPSSLSKSDSDLNYLGLGMTLQNISRTEAKQLTVGNSNSKQEDNNSLVNVAVDMVKMGYGGRIPDLSKSAVDMINMGYFNPELDRNQKVECLDMSVLSNPTDLSDARKKISKSYDMLNLSLNLGLSSPISSKALVQNESTNNFHNLNKADFSYPVTSLGLQNPTNLSRNEVDLCNTKYYPITTTIDEYSWKMDSNKKRDLGGYEGLFSDPHKSKTNTTSPSVINFNKPDQTIYRSNKINIPKNTQVIPSELKIPNPRGIMNACHGKNNQMEMVQNDSNYGQTKISKSDKVIQNIPLVSSLQYKTSYNTQLPLEPLRSIPNIPQIMDRYSNEERFLSGYQTPGTSLYHEKTLQMAHMFNSKNVTSTLHSVNSSSSLPIFSHTTMASTLSKDNCSTSNKTTIVASPKTLQSPSVLEADKKVRSRKKKAQSELKTNQPYHSVLASTDTTIKSSALQGSAFNFGPGPPGMNLTTGIYSENSGFLDDFRNTTANQFIAANYIAAAVAHQRPNKEPGSEKNTETVHQTSNQTSNNFPYLGHGQSRPRYPFVDSSTSSPLYEQYLQRHQEELIRQTGAQMMGLYPHGYPATLGMRQQFDSINRHTWL